MTYRQCTIVRDDVEDGTTMSETVWIPSKYAVIGTVLMFPKFREDVRDGWVVCAVYGEELGEEVVERSRDYIYQREASDV